MLASEIMIRANNWIDNDISTEESLEVINNIEEDFYSFKFLKQVEDTLDLVAEQDTYSLSTEKYDFDDIQKLTIDGIDYQKVNAKENFNYSYYNQGSNLTIKPEPMISTVGGIKIIYLYRPTLKTPTNYNSESLELVNDYGNRWIDLYLYALLQKYCVYNRDFDLANNYAMYYNSKEAELYKYIADNKPMMVSILRKIPYVWR